MSYEQNGPNGITRWNNYNKWAGNLGAISPSSSVHFSGPTKVEPNNILTSTCATYAQRPHSEDWRQAKNKNIEIGIIVFFFCYDFLIAKNALNSIEVLHSLGSHL